VRLLLRSADGALRNPGLVLALYLPGFVLSLLSAIAIAVGAYLLDRHGSWSQLIASGGYVTAAIELLSLASERYIPGMAPPQSLIAAAALVALASALAVLSVLFEALAYAYFAGGIFSRLQGKPEGFRATCRRWWGPMVRYSLLMLPVFVVVIPLGLFASFLLPVRGINGLIGKFFVFGLLLGILNGMLELGRASIVAREDGGVRRAMVRGLGSIARPALFVPAVLGWILYGLLSYVFSVDVIAAFVAVPALSIVPAFAIHQLAALAGAFIKLARLSLASELAASPPYAEPVDRTGRTSTSSANGEAVVRAGA
jgi:hypothetical protein